MKNPFVAAALAAKLLGALMQEAYLENFSRDHSGWTGMNRKGRTRFSEDRETLRAARLPKWLRQYSKRYGHGPDDVLRMHKKFD